MKNTTVGDLARQVLTTALARDKAIASREMANVWRSGKIETGSTVCMPNRPARPEKPELRRPGDMPRRRGKGLKGRVALLHALAHIELNAIDLAWDLIGRFANEELPRAFVDDWVGVADDEARHFLMLDDRLADLGSSYGSLVAHDGLWQAAEATAHDLCARLAVVPLVLEARGLDVTPAMIERLQRGADQISAAILQEIYKDEIQHVAAGARWFEFLALRRQKDPKGYWQSLVSLHFNGIIKEPLNHQARQKADFPRGFYEPLVS